MTYFMAHRAGALWVISQGFYLPLACIICIRPRTRESRDPGALHVRQMNSNWSHLYFIRVKFGYYRR